MGSALIDGILVIDKPKGATSMDVVRRVKRLTHVKRVGHAGTLDPIATGVLPICLGQATRLMEYLVDGRKVYRMEITLGADTDTYDAYGTVTSTGDASTIDRGDVEALLPLFTGPVQQRPPMYSALKHDGKRLYELARAGVEVERPERDVTVYHVTMQDWAPPKCTLEVECGRGFYMRTFAHDLGVALGCGAYLSELTRRRAGAFGIEDAITPDELEAAGDGWMQWLQPPDAALAKLEAVALDPAGERHVRNGQAVSLPATSVYAQHLEARRAYGPDGRFIGILRLNRPQNQWQPEKIFHTGKPSPLAPK